MEPNRLRAIAAEVTPGSRLADIGTDHAHLPVRLVRDGICPSAIASDIRVGPADAARRSVAEAGLTDRISVRLGDGLATVRPGECDTIVIAGMGGETIAAILGDAPWVKERHYTFILQPMTHAEDIRRYLWENGFVFSEKTVAEKRHIYTVLTARFTGEVTQPTVFACLIGAVSPSEKAYFRLLRQRLDKQKKGLSATGASTAATDALLRELDAYEKKEESL